MPTTGPILSKLKPVYCHTFDFRFNANLYSTNQNLSNDNNHNYNSDEITSASPRFYYEFLSKFRDFESLLVCDLYIVFPQHSRLLYSLLSQIFYRGRKNYIFNLTIRSSSTKALELITQYSSRHVFTFIKEEATCLLITINITNNNIIIIIIITLVPFAFPFIKLGPRTSSSDGDMSHFYSVVPPQCGSSIPNEVTIYFDHILSNSLFPAYPTVDK